MRERGNFMHVLTPAVVIQWSMCKAETRQASAGAQHEVDPELAVLPDA